jgi:bifunctional DNA-binding transcriptional regulator/antitoxin component of YhaV-PrlF toxin-antitoxin module
MSPIQLSIRALARMDAEGRILLPVNVRRALGLRQNQALELRTTGNGRLRRLMVTPRNSR